MYYCITWHPSPSLITLAFMSGEVRRILLDWDPYGGTDPLGMFPLFLKRTADVVAPRLSAVFRSGEFPALLEIGQCNPDSEKSTVLLCCQLPTDFHNISIVKGV